MPAKVASLQAFRSRRAGGAAADGPPVRAARGATGEDAAVAPDAAEAGPGGAERARRFRDLALPQLDAAYNLARHLARDAEAAEDIVQDAYLRALRGFDGYRGGDPRAWILQIVRNRFYDWARERRLDRTVPLPAGQAARRTRQARTSRTPMRARRRRRSPAPMRPWRCGRWSPACPRRSARRWCCARWRTCPIGRSPP